MAKIHTFELTVTVEVDLDDYALDYGMDAEAETTVDDAVGHIAGMLNELVDEKGKAMGYFAAYLRD